jgi:hypothetical protein
MNLRFPDKPSEIFPDVIEELDNGKSFAQSKLDGYRCLVTKDTKHKMIKRLTTPINDTGSGIFYLTRRGFNKGGPTSNPVSEQIINAVQELNLPDNTMLDAEWVFRRTKDHPEGLWIHDILWLNDTWQGNKPCIERYENILLPLLHGMKEPLHVPDLVMNGFKDFFMKQKLIPWTEGIVIKEKESLITGNITECAKIGSWLKLKWRSGHDGKKIVA